MEYPDFYDIARYLNANSRIVFSEKELACYAYDYVCDYEASKGKATVKHSIQELIDTLIDDWYTEIQNINADQPTILQLESWLYEMFEELGLVDMDWHDNQESELYAEFVQSHFEKGE